MPNNKKLDVHMVQHTHWDREWYFTSDDSRTMLYYDLKFLIEYLEKNDDKFTLDGQSSVIDDFLMYSPDWEERFKNVVKKGRLLVGPLYTQTDNVMPYGESISRNMEIGNHLAKKMGKSMQVAYLPDTFGHNNQSPQIFAMNGINNISFYRGLDPKDTNDLLYFNYVGPDGTSILGHWQTHYSTRGGAFAYTTKAFDENIVADYDKPGQFHPSVKSYAKRNLNLPIGIPVGTDQRPFRKEVKTILKDLNKKYSEFNFIASDYETMINEVVKDIKKRKVDLPTVTTELRQALTGRVHRSLLASRADIKQLLFKLESILVDVLEPLSIMATLNKVDVPWNMIEHVWKELFKSSAHDSYGCTNEDVVNKKLKFRLENAIRIAQGVIAMLTRIFSSKIINEAKDDKLVLFNFNHKPYSGLYEIETTVKRGFDDGKFTIKENNKTIPFSIINRNNVGAHERDALKLLIDVNDVPAFSYKILDIKYTKKDVYSSTKKVNEVKKNGMKVKVTPSAITLYKGKKEYKDFFRLAMDPSVGDTYDHSPLTWNDKKFFLNKYKIIESSEKNGTIRIEASGKVPSGISGWKANRPSVTQTAIIQITLTSVGPHVKLFVENKSENGRMIVLTDAHTKSDIWRHDQQFGIYERSLISKYHKTWNKPDKYGYEWDEFPTNLSPQQTFIMNDERNFTVFTKGTREHEMIKQGKTNKFAITLYRAFGVFGNKGTLWRPGRGSGASTTGPDNQLFRQKLEYQFIFNFDKLTDYERFELAQNVKEKTFYVPKEWGLDRTILRWETNIDYYSKSNKRNYKVKLPTEITKGKFVSTATYRTPDGKIIARFLNLGKETTCKTTMKKSRKLTQFTTKPVKVPQYGLINILIEG